MGFVPEGPSDATPLKPPNAESSPDAKTHSSDAHAYTSSADAAATSSAPPLAHSAYPPNYYPSGYPHAHGAGYPPQFPPPPGCPSAVIVVQHGRSGSEFPVFSPVPIPGLYMLPPRVPPSADQIILGYETCPPPTGCFETQTLTPIGWLAVVITFIFAWPLTCLPCCIPQFHERCQRPVFGYPPPPSVSHSATAQGFPVPSPMQPPVLPN